MDRDVNYPLIEIDGVVYEAVPRSWTFGQRVVRSIEYGV